MLVVRIDLVREGQDWWSFLCFSLTVNASYSIISIYTFSPFRKMAVDEDNDSDEEAKRNMTTVRHPFPPKYSLLKPVMISSYLKKHITTLVLSK